MCGYWTHGGYLNWDTGYGFKRWHAGRTWALAQQGLLAIAASPRFHPRPELGGWAKHMFDRGLALYERLSVAAADGKGIAPSNLYDVNVAPLGPSIRELFAARMQANAARAVALGLGEMQAPEPPPLYSFDGDIGRLAVTTQALLDRGASGQPARLPVRRHGAVPALRRRPAGRVERRGPSLGQLRRPGASARQGDRHLAAAQGRAARSARRCACCPRRAAVSTSHSRTRPSPTRGLSRRWWRRAARCRTRSSWIRPMLLGELDRDTVGDHPPAARPLHGRCAVSVLGPRGNGRGGAARRPPGHPRRPGPPAQSVSLRDVVYFYIAGEDSGYVVVPTGRRPRATAHILRPKAQSSAPRPGPTLAVQFAQIKRLRRLGLGVRIAPARSKERRGSVARSYAARSAAGKRCLNGRRLAGAVCLLEQPQLDGVLARAAFPRARPRRRGRTARRRPRAAR